jgi:hypothetical protein
MLDFQVCSIDINSSSANWGPFSFDFTKGLPPGDALAAATVTSTAPNGSDSTSALIDAGSVQVTGSVVSLRLQFPGAAMVGNHTLQFALTLASGARHRFGFGYVLVEL